MPGLPSASATATLSSRRFRPRRVHCPASAATRSATAAAGRLKPYQPSPKAAARARAASLLPPITTGMRRPRTGLGLTRTDSNRVNSPLNEATSSAHSVRIAATYSAVRRPRPANGTPSAANSSADQPIPTPSVSRPPDSTSSVAACLAVTTGLCSGSSSTPVASPILVVTAAAKLRPSSGSSQSAEAGTAIRPSPEYG